MTPDATCVGADDGVLEAAKRMTDRDIVVVLGVGKAPHPYGRRVRPG